MRHARGAVPFAYIYVACATGAVLATWSIDALSARIRVLPFALPDPETLAILFALSFWPMPLALAFAYVLPALAWPDLHAAGSMLMTAQVTAAAFAYYMIRSQNFTWRAHHVAVLAFLFEVARYVILVSIYFALNPPLFFSTQQAFLTVLRALVTAAYAFVLVPLQANVWRRLSRQKNARYCRAFRA